MRYMSLWRPGPNANPPTPELYAAMGALIEETRRDGTLILTGGWDPNSACTTVKATKGKITVLDGPYAETKELIAGFAIFQAKTKEEAVTFIRRFLDLVGDGNCEVREFPEDGN